LPQLQWFLHDHHWQTKRFCAREIHTRMPVILPEEHVDLG
jgi:hypothetical protein